MGTEVGSSFHDQPAPLDPRGGRSAAALWLPRAPAAAQLMSAVMCAGPEAFARGWRPCPEGGAFRLGPGRGMIILRAEDERQARELLSTMSALTLDALLVALDLLNSGRRWVAIDAADVLAAKGYRRWGEERSAFERKVAANLAVLSRLCWRASGGAQPLLEMSPQNHDAVFVFSAGPALRRSVRRGEGCSLARTVVALDHRHNRGSDALAKKLAVALALRETSAPLRSRDLLVSMGELGGGRGARQGRVVDRLLCAAGRLRDLNLYHVEIGPVLARRKGWVGKWLQSPVVVRPLPVAG